MAPSKHSRVCGSRPQVAKDELAQLSAAELEQLFDEHNFGVLQRERVKITVNVQRVNSELQDT